MASQVLVSCGGYRAGASGEQTFMAACIQLMTPQTQALIKENSITCATPLYYQQGHLGIL